MSRRWATIFLAVVLLITAAASFRVWQLSRSEPMPEVTVESVAPDRIEIETDVEVPTREVVLYFPSLADELVPEIRTVEESEIVYRQVAAIVKAILDGPEGEGLVGLFPEGVEFGGAYLGSFGVIYIDLRSDQLRPPASGSNMETLVIGSLVESVLANLPELEGVILLWNGVQPESFAGHLDTSKPLRGGQFPIASTS